MSRIAPSYRTPLTIAVLLHLCLFAFLFFHLPVRQFRMPGPVTKAKPVQAVAVDAKQVQDQVEKIRHEEAQKKAAEQARIHKLQQKAEAARRARILEQKRIAKLKAQQLLIKKQKAKEAARLNALKQKQAKALAAREKQLQEKLMQQQLSDETHQLDQAKATQDNGIVDRYKASILRAIGEQWVVPGGANKNLSSVYLIQLAPGGVVLDVKLIHSSGNSALDRSARVAIFKASPLPVPKDPALFDNFRQLRLTVSPKTVVKEDNETT